MNEQLMEFSPSALALSLAMPAGGVNTDDDWVKNMPGSSLLWELLSVLLNQLKKIYTRNKHAFG